MIRGERGRAREHEQDGQLDGQQDGQELGTLPEPGRSTSDGTMQEGGGDSPPAASLVNRTIRFPDEAHDGEQRRTSNVGAVASSG